LNAGFIGAKPTELNVTVTERWAYELLVLLKVCLLVTAILLYMFRTLFASILRRT